MRIVLLCEGDTESALREVLSQYLEERCQHLKAPRIGLEIKPLDGPVTSRRELQRRLEQNARRSEVLGVIALTDVYNEFANAEEAKSYLRECVAASEAKHMFYAHAAQFEVEASLLPYWDRITARLKVKAKPPGANPEQVNSMKPPSKHLSDLYAKAKKRYVKVTEASRNFARFGIEEAAEKCCELRALLDTLIDLCKKASTGEN